MTLPRERTLSSHWAAYEAQVIGPEETPEQRGEQQAAFYAGAAAFHSILARTGEEGTADIVSTVLASLQEELDGFCAAIAAAAES